MTDGGNGGQVVAAAVAERKIMKFGTRIMNSLIL